MPITYYLEWLVLIAACLLLVYRLKAFFFKSPKYSLEDPSALVSIIIPARNEAENLPIALSAIDDLSYKNKQVIVVDDHSEDDTAKIAESFGAQLIQAKSRPQDWGGKQWACHQALKAAKGEYLLFIDADVTLKKDSIEKALSYSIQNKLGLMSAIPFHLNPKFWERLLGAFQILILTGTAPFQTPRRNRLFAVGQFLLFTRACYDAIGGHEKIRQFISEDLALAAQVLENPNYSYGVYPGSDLFGVRMYKSFIEFFRGWRRNIRIGMHRSSFASFIDIFLLLFVLSKPLDMTKTPEFSTATVCCLLIMSWSQNKMGHFSLWGILLYPFSLLAFTTISLVSASDSLLGKPLSWKGRSYAVNKKQSSLQL